MSIHETDSIDIIAASAEACAAQVYANLREYQQGKRSKFVAHFALNVGESPVSDLTHLNFLSALGIVTTEPVEHTEDEDLKIGDDIDSTTNKIVAKDGTELLVTMLSGSDGVPYHATYRSPSSSSELS